MSIASVLEILRKEYRPALEEEVKNLASAVAASDWSLARSIAHRVAGTAGSYGFKECSLAARTIEDAVDAKDHAAVAPALEALKASL